MDSSAIAVRENRILNGEDTSSCSSTEYRRESYRSTDLGYQAIQYSWKEKDPPLFHSWESPSSSCSTSEESRRSQDGASGSDSHQTCSKYNGK